MGALSGANSACRRTKHDRSREAVAERQGRAVRPSDVPRKENAALTQARNIDNQPR